VRAGAAATLLAAGVAPVRRTAAVGQA